MICISPMDQAAHMLSDYFRDMTDGAIRRQADNLRNAGEISRETCEAILKLIDLRNEER